MNPLWDEIKNQIRPVLPKNSYSLWIDPISCLESKEFHMTEARVLEFVPDKVKIVFLDPVPRKPVGATEDNRFVLAL